MAASPALDTNAARGAAWTGRKFPNACPAPRDAFETLGAVFPIRARYLPTRECLKAATERFGPRALPLLTAWREVWRAAVGDVDAYAAALNIGPLGPETPGQAPAYPDWPGPNFIRPASFHVLEDAQVLVDALRMGAPFLLRLDPRDDKGRTKDHKRHFARRPGCRRIGEAARVAAVGGEGPDHGLGQSHAMFEATERMTPYWSLPAFAERAGRGMAVAQSADELVDILLDMAAQGHAQAFLKGTASKSGTWVVDLPGHGGAKAVAAALHDALGATWSSLQSRRGTRSFLVQAMAPPVREHRFFVVAHRVVASTASDRMLGILDAKAGRILDERVARLRRPARDPGYYDRGEATSEVDRALVARMAAGARDLARALRSSGLEMDCYVVDMGETDDGRAIPIEINGLSRSGRYAAPFGRVLEALRRRAGRIGAYGLPVATTRSPRLPVLDLAGAAAAGEVRRLLAEGGAESPHRSEFLARRRAGRGKRGEPRAGMTVGFGRDGGLTLLDASLDEEASRRSDEEILARIAPGGSLRRRWVRHLAKSVASDCANTARILGERLQAGSILLTRHVLCTGATLAEETLSPGWAHGWSSEHGSGMSREAGGWGIGILARAGDIDWMASLPHRSRYGECLVSLAVGSQVHVDWVTGGPGLPRLGGVGAGKSVATAASAAGRPRQIPDVSTLDRAALAGMVRPDPLAWGKSIRANETKVLEEIMLAGDAPEAWDGLRKRFLERCEKQEARRVRDEVFRVVRDLGRCTGDAMGRIVLARVGEGRDGYATLDPIRPRKGTLVVARVRDLDLAAMAEAMLARGEPRGLCLPAILSEGAPTWPFEADAGAA